MKTKFHRLTIVFFVITLLIVSNLYLSGNFSPRRQRNLEATTRKKNKKKLNENTEHKNELPLKHVQYEEYPIDLVKTLPEKWKKQFAALRDRNRPPIRLRMTSDYANPAWFGFFSVERSFKECSIPCRPIIDDKGRDFDISEYDIILYHHSYCERERQHNIESFEPISSDRRFLTIHANLRNEEPLEYRQCAEEIGGVNVFENSPVDMTICYSHNSTIVGNYFYTKPKSYIFKPKNDAEEAEMFQGMCAFVSNCVEHRMKFMKELSEYIPLRSFGGCLNNAQSQPGEAFKLEQLGKCKFYLAFENSLVKDYVTEKFYQAWMLLKPTIPVYYGAPNIQEFSPTAPGEHPAFIDTREFKTVKELGLYMQELLKDRKKYNKYFEWRKTGDPDKDFSKSFLERYSQRVINTPCKICVAGAEMQLARKILADLGYKPAEGKYKLSRKTFMEMLKAKGSESDQDLKNLHQIAYGRYWRHDNYKMDWNMIKYVTTDKWVELPNNSW